jgi:lipopolysaccharide cholinephosphotransferase
LVPERYYLQQLVKNARSCRDPNSEYVGDFCGYYHGQPRVKVKRALFSETTLLEFEGKRYRAPAGYDAWLTALYGDYMTLPPEKDRISHHSFIAYSLE